MRPCLVDGGQVSPNPAVCRLIGGVSLNHHICGLAPIQAGGWLFQPACVMALLSQGVSIHRKAAPLKVGGDSRKNPVEQLQRTV